MAEIKTAPVKERRVDDIDGDDVPPGAFEFFNSGERVDAGIIYVCPCGRGAKGALNFPPARALMGLGRQSGAADAAAFGASRRPLNLDELLSAKFCG